MLLETGSDAAPRPSLADVEETLTSGYARAHALEGERWRLERRLGELTAELGSVDGDAAADEIPRLVARMRRASGDLAELRGLLASLRERANDLRPARTADA